MQARECRNHFIVKLASCAHISGLNCQKTVCLLVCICLFSCTVSAQKIWTLTDCLTYAQNNNLEVQQAGLTQSKSILQLHAAENLYLPTVDARLRTAGNWGFIIDPSTNQLSNQFNYGNQASINFNLNLFDGFAASSETKLRRQQVAAATYGHQASTDAVLLSVTYYFLQVLLAQEQVEDSKQRAGLLAVQKRKIKAQVDKGVLSNRDLLNVQSEAAAEELLHVYAENNAEKALFNLRQVLGLPLQEEMIVQAIDIPDAWLRVALPPAEMLATPALPELQVAQAKIDAAHYAWQLERAGYMPTLALTGQTATRTSNYKAEGLGSQLRSNLNHQVGVSLYVPIFNRFQLRNTNDIAKLDVRSAQLAYQQVERETKARVLNAFLDYRAAAKKYAALQLQYSAIREEYRYAEKMLELGAIDVVEHSVTRSRLVTTQSELVQAKYDCFFKRKIVDFYQSKSLLL
jgi:outer membrane protein